MIDSHSPENLQQGHGQKLPWLIAASSDDTSPIYTKHLIYSLQVDNLELREGA